MTGWEKVYRAVLALYPRAFREAHGEDAAKLFRRLNDRARRRTGRSGAWRHAAVATARAFVGVAGEWREELKQGAPDPEAPIHESGRTKTMGSSIHDVRYALRALRKSPGFTLTVILLLALGIGATTTVFSVVDAVLLRSLPYPGSDELVYVGNPAHSLADFAIWKDEIRSVAVWGGMEGGEADLTGEGSPERVTSGRVTPEFFSVLGARAAAGRLFLEEEHVGEPEVAALSHDFWQRRWGGDPRVLGREIRLDDRRLAVVGVLAADFRPPGSLTWRGPPDVWVPLDPEDPERMRHGSHRLGVVGRLAKGASLEVARSSSTRAAAQ